MIAIAAALSYVATLAFAFGWKHLRPPAERDVAALRAEFEQTKSKVDALLAQTITRGRLTVSR